MFNLLSKLIDLNAAVAKHAKSSMVFDDALAFYTSKEYKDALPLMVEASELGNAQAMSILGTMYLFGQGTKENGEAAVRCLQAAVDAGYQDALPVLGMAYATGKAGVKINTLKAREILTLCAEQGDADSAKMLSMMDRGEGMFRDLKRKNHK